MPATRVNGNLQTISDDRLSGSVTEINVPNTPIAFFLEAPVDGTILINDEINFIHISVNTPAGVVHVAKDIIKGHI